MKHEIYGIKRDVTKALLRGEQEFALRGYISNIKKDVVNRPEVLRKNYGATEFKNGSVLMRIEFFFETDEETFEEINNSFLRSKGKEHKKCPFLLVNVD